MKKQPARLYIATLILSFILVPYTVNASSLPTQEQPKTTETMTDTQQKPAQTTTKSAASGEALTVIPIRLTDSDAGEKTVALEWDAVTGAAEYAIFLWDNNAWEEIDRTQETIEIASLTDYGTANIFKICAYNLAQQPIGESEEINALIPEKVKELKTTACSKTKVKLNWKAANGADCYKIYKKSTEGKYKLIQTIKKTTTHLDVKDKENYQFKVVPVFNGTLGAIPGMENQISYKNKEFVSMDHQKYTYKEMCDDIHSLCKKYSEYVSYDIIGYSEEGRKIYDVILGNKEADNTILVVSTLHAREYIATVVCMKQLEFYLLNYNKKVDGTKVSDAFSKCNIHYVMMANPDGVTISQTKKPFWKGNANGIDLNHNFPHSFKKSGRRKDGSYSGKKPAGESETKAIINLTKKLNKTQNLAVINYHAMGQIVFGDYSGKNKSLRADISSMYQIARKTTGYASSSGYGGSGNGNYRGYLLHKFKVPSITIEVGRITCPVPKYQYASTVNRNKLIVLREAVWLNKKK